MKIETDPGIIKDLAQEKEGENWGFRSFIKSVEIPDNRLDKSIQRFFKQVSKKIDCRKCANCCKERRPVIDKEDVTNITRELKVTAAKFKKEYLKKQDNGDGFIFNRSPCPFLKDNICSIHNFRPRDCASYPDIYKSGFETRLISVIHNCSICPIVYNVFELLKEEIWGMEDTELDEIEDYDDW
ncbi:MAG: YkgJ family cysteine cluster protein [Candidatus Aminicenantes bacterium]|nr:YkgJ family cysteine cluster protein [Candidatus Aminicenantes bacterium]